MKSGKFSQKCVFDAEIREENTFLTEELHFLPLYG